MTNISDMREFFDQWVELFERVEHMVIEGEDGLWLIDWLIDSWMIEGLVEISVNERHSGEPGMNTVHARLSTVHWTASILPWVRNSIVRQQQIMSLKQIK